MTTRTLVARIVTDWRRVLVPLAVAAVVNAIVYGAIVYPLSTRAAGAEQRAAAARQRLEAAEREAQELRQTVERTEQADRDLERFYREVLPRDVAGARRLTYARLAELADDHGLILTRRRFDLDDRHKGRLQRMQIEMALEGEYRDIRAFVHALESAPEFIVIENVSLTGGQTPDAPLSLTLRLATYFTGASSGV
ncbi:MAG TPA: type 4a pilus biogenesis protein PilO [Vicinamibacterales bacterium]